jgi:hypothetical protein
MTAAQQWTTFGLPKFRISADQTYRPDELSRRLTSRQIEAGTFSPQEFEYLGLGW